MLFGRRGSSPSESPFDLTPDPHIYDTIFDNKIHTFFVKKLCIKIEGRNSKKPPETIKFFNYFDRSQSVLYGLARYGADYAVLCETCGLLERYDLGLCAIAEDTVDCNAVPELL